MTRARTRTPARIEVRAFLGVIQAVALSVAGWLGSRAAGQLDALEARTRAVEMQVVELRARQGIPADNGYRWGVLPLIVDERDRDLHLARYKAKIDEKKSRKNRLL